METAEKRAEEQLKQLKDVSDVMVRGSSEIAGGTLVTATFTRNTKEVWAWYFEKSELRRIVYNTTDVAKIIESQLAPKSLMRVISDTPFQELVKSFIMSLLTIVFSVVVVYIVIRDPDNKALQVVTGLLGLTLGYFVGRADKS